MSRLFLVVSVILVVVMAPSVAWVAARASYAGDVRLKNPDIHVTPATKAELFKAVKGGKTVGHLHKGSEAEQNITGVASYAIYHHWWYIVFVTTERSAEPLPLIVGKFYDGTDTIRVFTDPGETLVLYTISGSLGIPYDVIDIYNTALGKLAE